MLRPDPFCFFPVVWPATYDSFGGVGITVADVENNLRFPGQYYDQETRLHYNYNRYLDPKTGRYVTTDPIGLDAGENLFVYVSNNPVNEVDPLGLFGNHGTLSRRAFHIERCSWLSSYASDISGFVDFMEGSQDPRNAHWHAMSNGDVNESIASAKERTDGYITEQLSRCNADGLGRALHAEQDRWAGGHSGYQPISSKWTWRDRLNHWWMDTTGGYEDVAVSWSVGLIKRFKEMCPCACGR